MAYLRFLSSLLCPSPHRLDLQIVQQKRKKFIMNRLLTPFLFLHLALALPNTPALTNRPPLLTRQTPSSLTLSAYTSANCAGTMFAYDATYTSNTEAQIKSYKLSRDLLPREQLDFSTPPVGNSNDCRPVPCPCALFYQSAPKDERTGCHTLESDEVGCFRLWLGDPPDE